jgi:hypothetical protein
MARLACSCFRGLPKAGGKKAFSNNIHYDHSSTLKTLQEIFGVKPLLGAAADPATKDLSDLFKGNCKDGNNNNNDDDGEECRE